MHYAYSGGGFEMRTTQNLYCLPTPSVDRKVEDDEKIKKG